MTTNELTDRLREQIRFLHRTARLYDEEDEAHAKQLATIIRTLVRDTKNMNSLLGQLRLLDALRFEDSAAELHPGNRLPEANLIMLTTPPADFDFFFALWIPGMDVPARESYPPRRFGEWWTVPVIKDGQGNLFSRQDLVLTVGDKEGHHIDRRLPADYWRLSRENAMGWNLVDENGERPMTSNPVPPAVRQIAHEMLVTFKHHGDDLGALGVEPPDPPPRSFPPSPETIERLTGGMTGD